MRAILKYERTEFGKAVRSGYERGTIRLPRNAMRRMDIRRDGVANTLTGVTKDNLLYEDDSDLRTEGTESRQPLGKEKE